MSACAFSLFLTLRPRQGLEAHGPLRLLSPSGKLGKEARGQGEETADHDAGSLRKVLGRAAQRLVEPGKPGERDAGAAVLEGVGLCGKAFQGLTLAPGAPLAEKGSPSPRVS